MFDFLLAGKKKKKKSPAVFILNFRIQIQTQICAELYTLCNSGPKLLSFWNYWEILLSFVMLFPFLCSSDAIFLYGCIYIGHWPNSSSYFYVLVSTLASVCLLLRRRARVWTFVFLYLNVDFWHLKRGNVWLFSQCIFVQIYINAGCHIGVNRCFGFRNLKRQVVGGLWSLNRPPVSCLQSQSAGVLKTHTPKPSSSQHVLRFFYIFSERAELNRL